MTTIKSSGASAHALQTEFLGRSEPTSNTLPTRGTHDESVNGLGALAGKHIRVGDGKQRSQATGFADQATSFFKSGPVQIAARVGKFMAAVPTTLARVAVRSLTFLPRLINEKILEPRAEKRFENAHADVLAQIRSPMKDGVATDLHVMERVYAYAQAAKTPLNADELRNLVAAGERIAHALSQAPQSTTQARSGSPVHLSVNGQQVQVASSTYSTRALSWYMVAAAARQDTARTQMGQNDGPADMTRATTFVMKDPDHATYRFLSAQPQATAGDIADARKLLPGSSANMRLDKLSTKDGAVELLVRFGSKADNDAASLPWGKLDEHISNPLSALVQTAMSNGTIDVDPKTFERSIQNFGLPYVHAALDQIQDAATARNDVDVLGQVMTLRRTIAAQSEQLGLASDRHGIERRGKEVHISLNQADNVQQTIKGTLTGPKAAQFEDEVINLRHGNSNLEQDYEFKNGSANQPICQQFGLDILRQDTVIDGRPVIKTDDADETTMRATRQLSDLTTNDGLTRLVSQYANQTSMAPIMQSIMQSLTESSSHTATSDDRLPIFLPDGRLGTPPGGESSFTVSKDKDGSVILNAELAFPRLARLNVLSPEKGMEAVNLNAERSFMTFNYALRLGADNSVTLARPLTYEVSIQPSNEDA